jgi:hypothetical protein
LGTYRYGEEHEDVAHGILPYLVTNIESGSEGCKLGSFIHVAYVDYDGNVQHKKADVAAPSTWVDVGTVAGVLSGDNLCASPVADAANSAVYIFYSDDHTIWYRRWTLAGGLEAPVVFYTVADPTVWNVIKNMTAYPDVTSGKIIVAWMQLYGVLAEDWNVYLEQMTIP